MPVCMWMLYMPVACGGQKGVLDTLELEFQMIMNLSIGAGTQIQVFCKSNQCSSTPEPYLWF